MSRVTDAVVKAREDGNNAFITICDDARGDGIPVAVKDNICTKGVRTTCASKLLENYIPPYNATVVDRLERAGAVIIGKTNMDEFGMGSTTENSAFGVVTNPHDPTRVAGGSGGGSAVAVATGIVPFALGSDTGGSVRTPAAYCGVVGFKPSYGAISRYGLVAYAPSFDTVGINARCVADCADLFEVIRGVDPMDSTTVEVEKVEAVTLQGKNIALLITENTSEKIKEKILDITEKIKGAGAAVSIISPEIYRGITETYYIMAMAQASSDLARYDGVRYGTRAVEYGSLEDMYVKTRDLFGDEVKRRILTGTFVLSEGHYDEYYLRALGAREGLKKRFERLFGEYDMLITPTTESIAPRIGQIKDSVSMYASDVYTVAANLIGAPAISVPAGRVDGLPVGMQIMTPPRTDLATLGYAEDIERLVKGDA